MADDLRADLESAIEKVEGASSSDVTPQANTAPESVPSSQVSDQGSDDQGQTGDSGGEVQPSEQPPAQAVVGSDPKITPQPKTPVTVADAPPKSWKPNLHPKWGTLDPEIKAEISRRDREVTKVFGETAQIREFHKQFSEIIRPYEAHMGAYGKPLDAIKNLLQSEYFLATAPAVQKARFAAKLIRDYGVNIKELDAALAGEQPTDPVNAQLEQMLEQRLTPLNRFLAQQTQVAQLNDARIQEAANVSIDQMSQQLDKYPHFEEVRDDMADIIEMNVRRQIFLTPEQAYQRAVAMNPEWAAESAKLLQQATQVQQAQANNARAQRALAASSSVRSLPSSSPTSVASGEGSSLRDDIEAAFNSITGR